MLLLLIYDYLKYFINGFKKTLYKNLKMSTMSRKGAPAILVAAVCVNTN